MILKYTRIVPFCLIIASALLLTACEDTDSSQFSSTITQDTFSTITSDTVAVNQPPIVYDYDTSEWTDIQHLDSSILLDIKYATADNFVKRQLYKCPRCLLRPKVAQAIASAHQTLRKQGLGLKMFDCYRPQPVQQMLWDIVPNASYVTPPAKGSMHNRGAAVDLTIVDAGGEELDMGTAFDYFGPPAHHTYMELDKAVLDNRKLLRETMAAVGMKHIRTEWWHYSLTDGAYELSDMQWNCEGVNL